MLARQITLQALQPAFAPQLAVERAVKLPCGGPYGTGGKFAAGTVLGCVGGTPQSEVRTLTISGAPTGSLITLTYTADKVYQATTANLVTTHASVAQLQAACDAIWSAGNTLVAGTPGSSFTITFQNTLANTRIGGNLVVSAAFTGGTSPAIAHARTTAGSSGAGQFDAYLDAGTNNAPTTARAVLKWDYLSDPLGGFVADAGATMAPYSPTIYEAGFFRVADLIGLDAAALADPGFRLVEGAALADTGAVIGIGV